MFELAAGRGVVVALGWTTDVHIDRVGIAVRVAVAASSPLSPLEPKPREARQAASTPAVFIPQTASRAALVGFPSCISLSSASIFSAPKVASKYSTTSALWS